MNEAFRAVQVTDNVYWVGAIDWAIRDFHGYLTSRGSTYNAYLIMAEQITLIDTVKAPFKDEMLARTSRFESRILLTRDRGLLKRSLVTHGYCVRENLPIQQLVEVIRRFDLQRSMHPFRRCIPCNGLLEPVSKEAILELLPPAVQQRHSEFHQCISCRKVYWAGSHDERIKALCGSLMNPAG